MANSATDCFRMVPKTVNLGKFEHRPDRHRSLASGFEVIVPLLALFLTGCGSIFTTSPDPTGNRSSSTLGSYYFLPKTRIKIDGAPANNGSSYVITISQVNEPDRDHRF